MKKLLLDHSASSFPVKLLAALLLTFALPWFSHGVWAQQSVTQETDRQAGGQSTTESDVDGKESSKDTETIHNLSTATEGISEASEASEGKRPPFDPRKLLSGGATPASIEELRFLEQQFAEVAERAKPSVVNIRMRNSQGSGVVVSRDGYILTAAHVISRPGAKATVIFPDMKEYKATALGMANRVDSGLLKIDEGQGDDFPYVDIGLSGDLSEGQWVVAIGHPGGLDRKRGLVTRTGRVLRSTSGVIQTDCTLVGGDSGGPLFNLEGEVVGIHSRIGMNLWDNLHVPVDVYSENWDDMAEGVLLDGRANLGVLVKDETNEIKSFSNDSPAEHAGLKEGDRIVQIGDDEISDAKELKRAIESRKAYSRANVVVQRGEETLNFELRFSVSVR